MDTATLNVGLPDRRRVPDFRGPASDKPKQPMERGHLPALDGLRGVAVLLVFLHHAAILPGEPRNLLDKLYSYVVIGFGWSGVDLFFVLSGFLITGILYDAKGREHFFRNFYVRRTLRIFPLYYGYCAVLFLILPWFITGQSARLQALNAAAPWYWTYLVNVKLALANSWQPSVEGTGHFWSLAVEEQFYLLWPFIVFSLSRRTLVRVAISVAAGALLFRIAWVTVAGAAFGPYVLLPGRVDALMVGAAIALVARGPGGLGTILGYLRLAGAGSMVVLLGVVLFCRSAYWDRAGVQTIGFTATAIMFGWVLATAISRRGGFASAVLTNSSLRFFGKYSYSLYVFTNLGGVLSARIGLHHGMFGEVLSSRIPGALLYAALRLAVAVPLSLASWHLYEKHFLEMKQRFAYKAPPPR